MCNTEVMIDERLFKIAFKKLKSSLYYDNTQNIVRDRIVEFELKDGEDIDEKLDDLWTKFSDEESRVELFDEIISSINYFALPKKIKKTREDGFITNYSSNQVEVDGVNYFIDMDIRGHILGVVWLMLIGYQVDHEIYEHSYGNRVRENLYNEFSSELTFSPYLFEPYFRQYESWRDKALDEAERFLNNSNNDIVLITLDFKRYYYSIDITKEFMDDCLELSINETTNHLKNVYYDDPEFEKYCIELNNFIFRVIEKYSRLFGKEYDNRNILPIGFLPSNVLANYALNKLDKAIQDGWNPIYYGRYVDDIIIVDKVESNSDIHRLLKKGELKKDDILQFYLEQCTTWKGYDKEFSEKKERTCDKCNDKCNNRKYAIFVKDEEGYSLNKMYNPSINDNSKIRIEYKDKKSSNEEKNDKVKVFYFKSGETNALIKCFRDVISKNKSEFRYMPEDERVFQQDDLNKVFSLENKETINKIRGVEGFSLDKFELSKLLGKYLRIGGLIRDKKEFGKKVLKNFNYTTLIENYSLWEKIIEVLVINEDFEELEEFTKRLFDAIDRVKDVSEKRDKDITQKIRGNLRKFLYAVLNRATSLVWGNEIDKCLSKICGKLNEDSYVDLRRGYFKTRMLDKSVIPIFVDMLERDSIFSGEVNLTHFEEIVNLATDTSIISKCDKSDYKYYPYLINMYDLSIMDCINQLKISNVEGNEPEYLKSIYVEKNYVTSKTRSDLLDKIWRKRTGKRKIENIDSDVKFDYIEIDGEKRDKLKIGIANVQLNKNYMINQIKGTPVRTYNRYCKVSKIVNDAVKEKVDLLVMPEAYLPFEWLATLTRTCIKNDLAVVTGIEHIVINDNKVCNLTAVILPYSCNIDSNKEVERNAYISFHRKKHYAPSEVDLIKGYRKECIEGKGYELYKWHGCYFPVYCCYELASAFDRSIFQSLADFIVAIEWNKDINYYSNILESLSRDMHCYCIQVNSSDYGDSRITKPSRTEEKDMVRTKGGINSTILVDEIDIRAIREFQSKEYNLQKNIKTFKTTPPGFDSNLALNKLVGKEVVKFFKGEEK